MQSDITGKEKIPEKDREALKGFMRGVSDTEKSMKELEKKMSYLPRIDSEGNSECPFAEDLYAQKEEAEKEVVRSVDWLKDCLPLLNREISRCQKNLNHIRNDAGRLATPEAKSQYVVAERMLMREYLEAVENRKRAEFLLEKAHVILKRARGRKYPGKIPQRRSFSPESAPPSHRITSGTGPGPQPDSRQGPALGTGLAGIFSIGPLM